VTVQYRIWEADVLTPNDLIAASSSTIHVPADRKLTLQHIRTLINTEPGMEEVFHQARHQEDPPFRVPQWSPWRNTSIMVMP
jgi:hypothetical protein